MELQISLVQMAYRTAGIPLPRTTGEQVRAGTPVQGLGQLRPGDLVFIPGADGTPAVPGHVALYVGGNLAVHSPRTGDVVRLVDITTWRSQIVGIRRVLPRPLDQTLGRLPLVPVAPGQHHTDMSPMVGCARLCR